MKKHAEYEAYVDSQGRAITAFNDRESARDKPHMLLIDIEGSDVIYVGYGNSMDEAIASATDVQKHYTKLYNFHQRNTSSRSRKHTDNCGRTGNKDCSIMNCKMDCSCWCHATGRLSASEPNIQVFPLSRRARRQRNKAAYEG